MRRGNAARTDIAAIAQRMTPKRARFARHHIHPFRPRLIARIHDKFNARCNAIGPTYRGCSVTSVQAE